MFTLPPNSQKKATNMMRTWTDFVDNGGIYINKDHYRELGKALGEHCFLQAKNWHSAADIDKSLEQTAAHEMGHVFCAILYHVLYRFKCDGSLLLGDFNMMDFESDLVRYISIRTHADGRKGLFASSYGTTKCGELIAELFARLWCHSGVSDGPFEVLSSILDCFEHGRLPTSLLESLRKIEPAEKKRRCGAESESDATSMRGMSARDMIKDSARAFGIEFLDDDFVFLAPARECDSKRLSKRQLQEFREREIERFRRIGSGVFDVDLESIPTDARRCKVFCQFLERINFCFDRAGNKKWVDELIRINKERGTKFKIKVGDISGPVMHMPRVIEVTPDFGEMIINSGFLVKSRLVTNSALTAFYKTKEAESLINKIADWVVANLRQNLMFLRSPDCDCKPSPVAAIVLSPEERERMRQSHNNLCLCLRQFEKQFGSFCTIQSRPCGCNYGSFVVPYGANDDIVRIWIESIYRKFSEYVGLREKLRFIFSQPICRAKFIIKFEDIPDDERTGEPVPLIINFLTGRLGENLECGIIINSRFCRDYVFLKKYNKNPSAAIEMIMNAAWKRAADAVRIWW